MNIQLFLSSVLPAQGRRFVVSIKNKIAIPRRVATNQQVVDTALQFEAQGYDVYFAVGGFVEALNPKGQPSREAEHAQWHRCLRIDLDVQTPGENKPHKYASKTEALQGLVNFINVLHLPMPIVIDSGGGFHVYWIFDRDITRDVWQPLADRLKSACVLHGLRADPTATADAARILRMPGTHNFKPHFGADGALVDCANPNSPLLPADPAQFDALLPQVQALQAAGVAVAMVRNSAAPVAQSELSAGVNSHTPYDIGSVIRECSVMTDMLAKHGEGYHNQQWYLMLNAVQASMHTDKQKRDIALVLSDGWRDNGKAFDINDFDRTFARAKGGHPFSCATMANSGEPASSLCRACPYYADALPSVGRLGYNGFQSKRTPVQQQPVAAVTSNGQSVTLPPFIFHPDGRTEVIDGRLGNGHFSITNKMPSKLVTNGNGKASPKSILGQYEIKEISRSETQVDLTFTRGTDPLVTVSFPATMLSHAQELANVLNNNSIYLGATKSAAEDFKAFMSTFLQELQRLKKFSNTAEKCGWADGGDFVLGHTTFHKDGTSTLANAVGHVRMEHYTSAGDVNEWRTAFDMILSSGPERQMLLALGIASPLMQFSGQQAVLVNTYSEDSGAGKSTTNDAVTSIWGSPNDLRLALHDTANATFQLAGVTGSLPFVLDELTGADGEQLFQQIHTLAQGREKLRLGQNAKVVIPKVHWKFLAFSSANESVVSRLMNNRNADRGALARVFELELSVIAEQTVVNNKATMQKLEDNYGWLGPEVCKLIMSQPQTYWKDRVSNAIKRWDGVFGSAGSNRYQSIVAALAEIGAEIGKQLGFNFDVNAIKSEALKHWKIQQGMVKSLRIEPMEYVRHYYIEYVNDMMRYIGGNAGNRDPASKGPCAGELHRPLKSTIDTLVVTEKQLREYVQSKKGSWDSVRNAIERDTSGAVASKGKRHFLANAGVSPAYLKCFEFNLTVLNSLPHAVTTTQPTTAAPTTQVLP